MNGNRACVFWLVIELFKCINLILTSANKPQVVVDRSESGEYNEYVHYVRDGVRIRQHERVQVVEVYCRSWRQLEMGDYHQQPLIGQKSESTYK